MRMIFSKSLGQALLVLFVLGGLLHFSFLSTPRFVIFDEVGYGMVSTSYIGNHETFWDIHPPHGKLLIGMAAKLLGHPGDFNFPSPGESYGSHPIFSLRFLPALWGTLIPIVFVLVLMQLGASLSTAFLGGVFLVFDNALLAQTRVIAIDGLLVLSLLSALSLFLYAIKEKRIVLFFLVGCAAGLAVGTKFTGLSIFPLMALLSLEQWYQSRTLVSAILWFRHWLWIGLGFTLVYLSGWLAHLKLLYRPGIYESLAQYTGNFFHDLSLTHVLMFSRNTAVRDTHISASEWYGWPIMYHPVYMWEGGENGQMYLVGNPVVWWGALLGLLVGFMLFIRKRMGSHRAPFATKLWIPLAAYLASYLPYIPIKRPLFLYHYLPPLVYSVMATVLVLEEFKWIRKNTKSRVYKVYIPFVVLTVIAFILVSPYTYGYSSFFPQIRPYLFLDSFPKPDLKEFETLLSP